MPHVDIDYFDAHFADTPGPSIRFLLDSDLLSLLLQSPLMAQVARIARLPYLAGSPTIYPDASAKPFGFPAGIVLTTEAGWLYPLSAPDMGCGYLVVDSGIEIDPDAVDPQALNDAFEELVAKVDIGSSERERLTRPVREIMAEGLSAIGAPIHFTTKLAEAEESNSWRPHANLLETDFIDTALQASLGSAAGHFVACYVVEHRLTSTTPAAGRLIVVVHVGAAPVRDHLNKRGVFAEFAARSVDKGISTIEDAADGLFAVDLSSVEGQSLLGTAMASRNFGYANRQLIADVIIRILTTRLSQYAVSDPTQLRHVDHVAFESVNGTVRSRRGLQPLHADRPVFITGGQHTHGYLATSGHNATIVDGLCCHGTTVRDTRAIPTSVWTGSSSDLNPSHVRRWADTMVSNTKLDERQFWSDLSNLEAVMSYLARCDIAQPSARLRQLMNYRELKL